MQQLKQDFRKTHTKTAWVEGSLESWLSWLNPLYWFSGIGGWFSGLLHGILHIVGFIVLIILVIKFAPRMCKCCLKIITKACTNTRPEPPKSRMMMAYIPVGRPKDTKEVYRHREIQIPKNLNKKEGMLRQNIGSLEPFKILEFFL